MGDGGVGVGVLSTVRKAVGGRVDDPHDERGASERRDLTAHVPVESFALGAERRRAEDMQRLFARPVALGRRHGDTTFFTRAAPSWRQSEWRAGPRFLFVPWSRTGRAPE